MCQKYIGQLRWLSTRTRPNIALTLGILASQLLIRPGYVKGCLIRLWRYVSGTRHLSMHYKSLVLNVHVDASFSGGVGRNRLGLATYLVNRERN